jgi:hypothetical protein
VTEIIIDGFACDNEDKGPVESTGDFRAIFGDPFKDFRAMTAPKNQWQEIEIDLNPIPTPNPFSPESFEQTFQQVSKPRVKGIGEDWFRNLLRSGLHNAERNKEINQKRAELSQDDFTKWLDSAYRDGSVGDEPKFTKHNMEVAYQAGAAKNIATASDPTSKQQHGDHKTDIKIAEKTKTSQDHKMKKQRALQAAIKRLAAINGKRPKDPTKIKAWSDRRQALVKQIQEKRESIRFSDKRVSGLREERRGN